MEIPSPEIPKTGRRFAIPDIHGCPKTLLALLKQIGPNEDDQVFFLGDYVNKGPDSQGTLDFLISLSEKPNYHFIRGNHDQLLLDHLKGENLLPPEKIKKLNIQSFDQRGNYDQYISFIEASVYYLNLDQFLLVHAGFDFSSENAFDDTQRMMNIVGFSYNDKLANHKTIVHGHLPLPLETIEMKIQNQERILPLDNGCVYLGERPGHGNLLALDLDSKEMFKQKRID